MTARWISLHVFHGGDLDRLLAEALGPVVRVLSDEGLIEDAFFLRYWNGGPHVRLRLAAAGADDAPIVSAVERAFARHVAATPAAPMSEDEYARTSAKVAAVEELAAVRRGVGGEARELLRPEGVERRAYALDLARYGGEARRAAIEDHFCRSSELAWFILARTAGRASRVTLALHLAAAAYHALALRRDDAVDLFRRLGAVVERFTETRETGDADALADEDRAALRHQLDGGASLIDQTPVVTAVVRWWQDELTSHAARLVASPADAGAPSTAAIVMDHVHLLNNRLGLTVSEECRLYRWIAAALERTHDREEERP